MFDGHVIGEPLTRRRPAGDATGPSGPGPGVEPTAAGGGAGASLGSQAAAYEHRVPSPTRGSWGHRQHEPPREWPGPRGDGDLHRVEAGMRAQVAVSQSG